MKKIILGLILILNVIVAKATDKPIVAEVVFENSTGKQLSAGEFFVIETNEKIKISDTKSFTITLPSKGKYVFGFSTKEFTAYTYYPARITEKKNRITIRLESNESFKLKNNALDFPINLNKELTDAQIEQKIIDGKLNFIIHSLDNSIPTEFKAFKEKYGIGLVNENCVIDPISFKKATKNNKMISDFLTKKYGSDWLNDLSFKPFGMK